MRGMELLIAAVLVALLGVLAQAAGSDSRDADTRSTQDMSQSGAALDSARATVGRTVAVTAMSPS